MYARPTRLEDGRFSVPENYDGVAFMEKRTEPEPAQERSIKVLGSPSSEAKISPNTPIAPTVSASADISESAESKSKMSGMKKAAADAKETIGGFFERIPFSGFFSRLGIGANNTLSLPKIGTEEILILATAAFLFFSKDGDKECAIMLILLILVAK